MTSRAPLDDRAVQKINRAERWKRIGIAFTAFAVAVVAGLLGWTIGKILEVQDDIRRTQINGTPTGKAILDTAETIESCTNPEGECYRRTQETQSGAVNAINEITIYAVTCAQQNPGASVDTIQECVQALYDLNHPEPAE